MEYEISPALPEEAGILEALFLDYYRDLEGFGIQYALNREKLPEVLSARIRSRMYLCVLARAQDGEAAGFLMASVSRLAGEYLCRGEGAVGYVHHVYVAPAHRRRGLALGLLDAARDWLLGQGVSALELDVLGGNEPARRFYEAAGFAPAAVTMYKALEENTP